MKRLNKLALHIILFLAITVLPVIWVITTTNGLKALISTSQLIFGTQITYGTISGAIIGAPINIQNLNLEFNQSKLTIDNLLVNCKSKVFSAHNVQLRDIGSIIPLIINKVDGTIEFKGHKQFLKLHLIGTAEQATINAHINITHNIGSWSIDKLKANINATHLELQGYHVKNLKAHINIPDNTRDLLGIFFSADSITVHNNVITHARFVMSGKINRHIIDAAAICNKVPINVNATATIDNKNWHISKLNLKILTMLLHGNAKILLNTNKLDATLNLDTDDLSLLMKFMPDVTRLKGKFHTNMQLTGNIDTPLITSVSSITDITATIPSLGIKIKPGELHLTKDSTGKFTITGNGNMRRGPGTFSLNGHIEPFKDNIPNSIQIIGDNIEFINNQNAHLIASMNLLLHYALDTNSLDLTGDVAINEGHITIRDKITHTVKSKDVVFINEPYNHLTKNNYGKTININPNINLRIIEGVKFTGFGLYANVSGKLSITQRHDALYADGRVTIKNGTFQLPGQKLLINKGRLLYPPGTLLVNPVLDIKLHDQSQQLELAVQGTIQKMLITESGLSSNKDRALSQALLTGTSVISGNLLQDKLKISEIGLTDRYESNIEFFENPSHNKTSIKNKDLVIGRPLGKKFYLQYLHSIGEANQKVRLKYSLNPMWAIGIESGTQGGGADLSFSIERD